VALGADEAVAAELDGGEGEVVPENDGAVDCGAAGGLAGVVFAASLLFVELPLTIPPIARTAMTAATTHGHFFFGF
jgi:hypothetical protein